MYEQNVLSGHNKVIQAHVQSRATGIEDKGHHVLRAVVGARPGFRIAHVATVAVQATGHLYLLCARVKLFFAEWRWCL